MKLLRPTRPEEKSTGSEDCGRHCGGMKFLLAMASQRRHCGICGGNKLVLLRRPMAHPGCDDR